MRTAHGDGMDGDEASAPAGMDDVEATPLRETEARRQQERRLQEKRLHEKQMQEKHRREQGRERPTEETADEGQDEDEERRTNRENASSASAASGSASASAPASAATSTAFRAMQQPAALVATPPLPSQDDGPLPRAASAPSIPEGMADSAISPRLPPPLFRPR